MESFYSCASVLSSADQGFAASGLLPDSHALGPALLHALVHVHMLVGDASVNGILGERDECQMSLAFDHGLGSVRGGGEILRGSVDYALRDGIMPR